MSSVRERTTLVGGKSLRLLLVAALGVLILPCLLGPGLIAQDRKPDPMKPPQLGDNGVSNLPSSRGGKQQEKAENSTFFAGELPGKTVSRIVDGSPVVHTDPSGTELRNPSRSATSRVILRPEDGRYTARVVTPTVYASGVMFIKVGSSTSVHFLTSDTFALDVPTLIWLGKHGISRLTLEIYSTKSPAKPLKLTVDIDQDQEIVFLRF